MKKYILKENETCDDAYFRIAGEENLYGKAFFGHKGKRKEKRKLAYIWKQLIKQDKERRLKCHNIPQL